MGSVRFGESDGAGMVFPSTYSIAVPAYYASLCAVALTASRIGGRYERSMVFVLVAGSLATLVAQCISRRYVPLGLFTCIDVCVAMGFIRILRRYRRRWIAGAVVLQCVIVAIDVLQRLHLDASEMAYLNEDSLLDYAIMGALIYGCVRRRYGPPYAIPSSLNRPTPVSQHEAARTLF